MLTDIRALADQFLIALPNINRVMKEVASWTNSFIFIWW